MTDDREDRATRLRRLRLRSWRRGIREMDLILGGYADEHLDGMVPDEVDVYEAALGEADHDLLNWVTGRDAPPPRYAQLMAALNRRAARSR
ncbi:succinate dehydrogenase assembly factor 2 [Jannaschia sp. LMIT008]|uniref:succinate dehydrogenase assembly factor 2 n=1 Tax=Jannaschia maritima TaxID=3032585 RepID=UPI0028110AD2|nr:succinate dehydrogenase assembly factor 2 [Jannaschia sp. LMIT008]